jgi:hypothetical protein
MLHINVLGLGYYSPKRQPRVARATISSSRVWALACQSGVKAALADKTRVKAMLKQDFVSRSHTLHAAGQLVKATVLLQRMLRGETAPDATSGTTGCIALTGREPLIIDAKANTIEETDSPNLARPASTQPRMLRALDIKGQSGLALRGLIKRAPLSTPDIVPEGARFIAGTFSNPAGSRAYKLFIPSRYQGQPLPLSSCYTAAPSRLTISPPAPG